MSLEAQIHIYSLEDKYQSSILEVLLKSTVQGRGNPAWYSELKIFPPFGKNVKK